MSKFHQLKLTQNIPVDIETAWDFFSSPANLAKITPDYMGFVTKTGFELGPKMYPGQIITYKVSPVLSIPINWMTEITHVVDKQYFVDEQRFGPYALWHHQHHFKAIKGGVEMTDLVNYVIPLGLLGNFANTLFVKKQLQDIFEYRVQAVESLFGKFN